MMKFQTNRAAAIKTLFILVFSLIASGCTISERNHAESSNPAFLTPFHNEWGVQLFIDELDGAAVKYGELDRLALDGGSHDIGVRMEYQPAAGSSVVVGSLGNLLLRGATNKTFEFDITVDLVEGHNNGLTVKSTDDGFELLVFDETAGGVVILEQQFKYEDGKFVRLF